MFPWSKLKSDGRVGKVMKLYAHKVFLDSFYLVYFWRYCRRKRQKKSVKETRKTRNDRNMQCQVHNSQQKCTKIRTIIANG